jgi:hypothetical protein
MDICCVLSGRCLCDELITRPEESYRLWRFVVCNQETSWKKSHSPRWAAVPKNAKIIKANPYKGQYVFQSKLSVVLRFSREDITKFLVERNSCSQSEAWATREKPTNAPIIHSIY